MVVQPGIVHCKSALLALVDLLRISSSLFGRHRRVAVRKVHRYYSCAFLIYVR
jgi:hypothetical protein